MVKAIIFIVISSILFYLSWSSLGNHRKHGFWRFLGFESILVLILVNAAHWFQDLFSIQQIFSWIFLFGSLVLALGSFRKLNKEGKPKNVVENTTLLVTSGIYSSIRHPLYGSLILLGIGAFLKNINFYSIILVIAVFICFYLTAKVEESENKEIFGKEYEAYMGRSKMFIPFVI
jgi:protein-S-isoprenylcysteine O-methyltransferase Ste14